MTILNYGIANSLILLTQKSLAERMKLGLLNTVLGLGIVFAVLAFLIFIISLLKYLPGLLSGNNNADNMQDDKTTTDESISTDLISYEATETDLIDDYELVAVITAAISAFEAESGSNASAGGFVVRSIRKINSRRI